MFGLVPVSSSSMPFVVKSPEGRPPVKPYIRRNVGNTAADGIKYLSTISTSDEGDSSAKESRQAFALKEAQKLDSVLIIQSAFRTYKNRLLVDDIRQTFSVADTQSRKGPLEGLLEQCKGFLQREPHKRGFI